MYIQALIPISRMYIQIVEDAECSIFTQISAFLFNQEYETTPYDFADQSQFTNRAWRLNMHR